MFSLIHSFLICTIIFTKKSAKTTLPLYPLLLKPLRCGTIEYNTYLQRSYKVI